MSLHCGLAAAAKVEAITFRRCVGITALNAFHFRRAIKRRLQIKTQRKFAAACKDYLLRQLEGGPRRKTGLERLLNARLAKTQSGHVQALPTLPSGMAQVGLS